MGIVRPDNSKGNDNLLAAALDYAERFGWSIVPIAGDKRPPKGFRLKSRYSTVATPDQIKGWFKRYAVTGIAIVCGMVNGGLIVRDFDDEAAYKRWARRFPELARSMPTVRTRRGYHVYFRCETTVRSRRLENGELRADRHYVVCPPSLHPQGGEYCWIIKPVPGHLPVISDPAQAGLLDVIEQVEQIEQTEPLERTEKIEKKDVVVGESGDQVERAITATLPTGPGQRNGQIFEFARHLKAIPELCDLSALSLKPIVKRWHQLALPVIGTKPFEETYLDFVRAWGAVMLPAGTKSLAPILEAADSAGIPPEATEYDNPQVCRLAGFCREMQRRAGKGPFFLSCATVARLFNVIPMTAWRWLQILEVDGLLDAVRRGSPKTGKATRYRYLGRSNCDEST